MMFREKVVFIIHNVRDLLMAHSFIFTVLIVTIFFLRELHYFSHSVTFVALNKHLNFFFFFFFWWY
jgi:hypothetical protein